MAMLMLSTVPFSVGRAAFVDAPPISPGSSGMIFVKMAVEGREDPFLAILDTAAQYSVIAPEIAEEAGLLAAEVLQRITLSHRGGRTPGRLVRTTMTMLADEGDGLDVDATIFVPDGAWPTGRSFIGYSTFLDQVRIGLDPQENHIYFGGY